MSQARRRQPALALLAAAATLSFAAGARAADGDGAVAGGSADAASAASTERPPPPRYFYQNYDYGSQALYSPVWVFLNRGYDVLQDHVATRNIFGQHYRTNTGNGVRNLENPFPAVRADGWKTFLTEEILSAELHAAHGTLGAELHAAPHRWRHHLHGAGRVVRRLFGTAAASVVGPDVDGVGAGERDDREQGDRGSTTPTRSRTSGCSTSPG